MSQLSIAPMIDWTNRHFRYFMRLLCPHALLYTEMITSGAMLNNTLRALKYSVKEHPLVIQLGGSSPKELANCARLAKAWGYDQINLNVGCPSDRVQSGYFGACLMAKPNLVAECVDAMQQAISLPITVKTRLGIDDFDSYDFITDFVNTVSNTGCNSFIIHARKAWLKGLSPKQNRTIPPLNYPFVYQLKQDLPHLTMTINGGINSLEEVLTHLGYVDAVMVGRLAMNNPYQCAIIDSHLNKSILPDRVEVLRKYLDYCHNQYKHGVSPSWLLKPLFALANGQAGAKNWRQKLTSFQQRKENDFYQLAGYIPNEHEDARFEL